MDGGDALGGYPGRRAGGGSPGAAHCDGSSNRGEDERDKQAGSVGLISGFVRGVFAKRRDVRLRTEEKHKRYYIVEIRKI